MLKYRNLTLDQISELVGKFGKDKVTVTTGPDGSVIEVDDGIVGPSGRELQLGKQTPLPQRPEDAVIDTVPNKNFPEMFVARFSAPEFTSMCPVTGQPDFARIFIDYIPGKLMIESKALKLFLGSFRNHGAFHEECTMLIARRLQEALAVTEESKPRWFRIAAYWYPRGGIPIDVFWQSGEPPKRMLIPELPKLDFAGR